MVTIKRKVTIKTKTAQEETPVAVENSNVTLRRKQPVVASEPVPKPISPNQTPAKHANTGKIWGGIAITAAIFVGVYFLGFNRNDNTGDNHVSTPTEQTTPIGETTQLGANEQIETSDTATRREGTAADNNSETTTSSKANENPVSTQSQVTQQKQDVTSIASVATIPMSDNVEENARRVIRGDFGNGQERKDKLGSAYAEIQSKVNEMYRQGLVD